MRWHRVGAGLTTLILGAAFLVTAPQAASAADGLGMPHFEFGGSSKVATAFDTLGNASADSAKAIVVQADGKIIVAGRAGDNSFSTMAVVRYLPDGTLDQTFGTGGKKVIGFQSGAHSQVNAVKVDGSGRIVLAGVVADTAALTDAASQFAIVRLTPTGALDGTFGTGGRTVTNVGVGGGQARGLFVLENGKPIVVGYGRSVNGGDAKGKVLRYTAGGSLDGSFAVGGVRTLVMAGRNWLVANAVDVQFSGRIVIGGYVTNGADQRALAAGLTADGSLDPTFDNDGYIEKNLLGSSDVFNAVQVLDEGAFFNNPRILFGGTDFLDDPLRSALVWRVTNSGANDATYGAGGTAYPNLMGLDLTGLAARADGSSVIAGTYQQDQVLAWLRPDGSVATDYGQNGLSIAHLPGTANTSGVTFGAGGAAYVTGMNHVVTDDFVTTAWNGVAVAAPTKPVIRAVLKRGNNVMVDLVPGAGGGRLTAFYYRFERLNPRGVAGPISGFNVLAGNARRLTIPVSRQQPGVRVYLTAAGLFNQSAEVVTMWHQRRLGAVRGCVPVVPHTVQFQGARAVIIFPRRTSACGSWKFGPRFVAIPRGRTHVATPGLALGRGFGVNFRANTLLVPMTIRRG